MTEAADFAVKRLPALLQKAVNLSARVSDAETMASLSRTIDFCLISVYWEKRNLKDEGGHASTELSEDERLEAKRLYDQALAILEGESTTPDKVAFALSIASAVQSCQKVALGQCNNLWRAAADWIGKSPWNTKIDTEVQGDLERNLVRAALGEEHVEASRVMHVFRRLQLVLDKTGDGAREIASFVSEYVNLQLPRDSMIGLPGTEALVQILLESLQKEKARDRERIAEALVRLWAQLAFDHHVSEALRLIDQAWSVSRTSVDLWVVQAVFRAIAVIVTFPEISQTDICKMCSWLKDDLGRPNMAVDEARIAAIIEFCEHTNLGMRVEDFIETPERNHMNKQAAENLDESLSQLLAGRIAKSAGNDLESAFRDLDQIRYLAKRTPSEGVRDAYLTLINTLGEQDPRRLDLYREYQELESHSAAAMQWKQIARAAADPRLHRYRQQDLQKLVERMTHELLPEPEWPFEPLYKAIWADVSIGSQAIDLVGRAYDALAREAFFEAILAHRILALRAAQPTFYKDVFVLEILLGGREEDARWNPRTAMLMLAPNGAMPINGESTRIHLFNQSSGLSIATVSQAEDYLRFFCGAVQGDDGPFTVTESTDELLRRLKPGTPSLQADRIPPLHAVTSKFIGSGQESEAEAIWECDAIVNYSSALFAAKFRIQASGMVEMTDDEPIITDLPIRQPRFRDGFRWFY